MNACRYSKKYTGIRAPRCNNGKGCAKCWEIFFTAGPQADAIPVKNSAKDRFGRDRKKLRDIAEDARQAVHLGIFMRHYGEYTKYSAFIKKPYVTGTPGDDRMLLCAIGAAAEAGELLDCFKKVYFHDKSRRKTISEARRKRIIGEMGDVMWYFDVLLREFGITMREVIQTNMDALAER